MSKPIKIVLLALTLFYNGYILAQDEPGKSAEHPKIGLVLSGGGAKGIAHIGILKAMEKEGIRPDFITGTSMGSIIGGLYSLGYTANQLDSIIRSVNWDMVLSNNVPLNLIAYEEKEYYNRYLFDFPFENGKLKLPSGLIEGQVLSELLQRFTWPANKYDSFDDFPIPFRCVATDVSTGQPIVFDSGSLAKAIRSSMAIPTAFTAVDLDNTMVVDGGVVDNFPVEIARQMGANFIIGVNVGDGLKPAEELSGMSDILFQVSMIPSLLKTDDQISQCDIYIKPDLKDNGTASFSNYTEILQLGDSAGERFRPEFKILAEKLNRKGVNLKPLNIKRDSIIINEIKIEGNQYVNDKVILSKLGIKKGKKVSVFDIENGIRAIFGSNNFSKVTYEINKVNPLSNYSLTIRTYEKKPATIRGAFHYDNTFSAGIVLNLTLRNLLGKSSRTMFISDISKNPKLRLDYLKYVSRGKNLGLTLRYEYLNQQIPNYEEGELKDIDISKENNFHAGLITTQSLKRSLYLGVSYQFNNQKSKFKYIAPEGIKNGAFNFAKAELVFNINTFNDRNYPVSGRGMIIGGNFYFENNYKIRYDKGIDTVYIPILMDESFTIPLSEDQFNDLIVKPQTPGFYALAFFSYIEYIKMARRFQVIPNISLGLTLSNQDDAIFNNYRIGGYQQVRFSDNPFLGLNYSEVDYENFLITGLYFQNILLKNIYLMYGANLLLPQEHIPLDDLDSFNFSEMFENNSLLGYGLELTYKSFLGPISFGLNRNTRDPYFRYYLSIGYSFNFSD